MQIKWSGIVITIIIIKTTLQSPRFPRRTYYYIHLPTTGEKKKKAKWKQHAETRAEEKIASYLWVDGEETGRKLCFGSVACHHEQAPAWRRLSRVGFLPWGGGLWVVYLDSNQGRGSQSGNQSRKKTTGRGLDGLIGDEEENRKRNWGFDRTSFLSPAVS